jgi:hypothetical protein
LKVSENQRKPEQETLLFWNSQHAIADEQTIFFNALGSYDPMVFVEFLVCSGLITGIAACLTGTYNLRHAFGANGR